MPPRSKPVRGLVGLAGTDSEPDLDDVAPISIIRKSPQQAKRPRGRPPAAHKVTKPVSSLAHARNSKTISRVQTSPRHALSDRSNLVRPLETGAGDDSLAVPASPAPDEYVPVPTNQSKSSRGRPAKARARPAITEPSARMRDGEEDTAGEAEDRMAAETVERHAEPIADAMELEDNSYRGVDNEDQRLDDSSMRRKLGDLTRKYESLESRHRDLRDVGVAEAERNFDKLRKQADDNAAASSRLIDELKAELATQATQLRQGEEVLQQLENSEARCKDLQSSLTKSKGALDEARAEIKTLTTKLSAFRSAEATGKGPGSARKAGPGAHRAAPADVVQAGQAKEDLYGDLTGLILRGVQLGESEDVFDCIQTGRNGTLHFKLGLDKAEPADNYEDVQFTYRPQLDEDRDGDLMEVLPDYLVEEITFPRTHAAKFYARVIKSLTERLE